MHGGAGFKSPALLPLWGQEMSRDRGWLELVLLRGLLPALPELGRDGPRPHKTLNYYISPWPVAPHFGTSMKQPHSCAGRVLSLAGRGPYS